MFSKLIKITGIFFLVFIICCSLWENSYAISRDLEQFIKEGKKVRIKVNSARSKDNYHYIIPYQDMNINLLPGSKHKTKLNKNRKYIIKLKNKGKPYWKIQVFSTGEKEKAEKVKKDLIKSGFKNVNINPHNEVFRVILGDYLSQKSAQKNISRLKAEGWQPWLRKFYENNGKIMAVFDAYGNLIFQGNYFYLKDKIKLDGDTYQGKIEFIYEKDKKIDIYNTTSLKKAAADILYNLNKNRGFNNSSLLKAETVIVRSLLLQQTLESNKGFLESPYFQGTNTVPPEILKAISETEGEIIGKKKRQNDIINFSGLLEKGRKYLSEPKKYVKKFKNYSYKNILKKEFKSFHLISLDKVLKEEIKVDARVKWGLNYQEIRQITWKGPRIINILNLNLEVSNLSLRSFLSQNKKSGFTYLDQLVRENKALAGINGGFFTSRGVPLGLVMIKGKVVSDSIYNRSAVGITRKGEVLFADIDWKGYINGDLEIDKINQKPQLNEVAIINNYYGDNILVNNPDNKIIILQNNKVSRIINSKSLQNNEYKIPLSQQLEVIIINGNSRKFFDQYQIGSRISVKNYFTSEWENKNLISIIQAGPNLLTDGSIDITGNQENFQSDVIQGKAPRSAVGVTEDNHLLFVTVDGRQEHLSIGMTLKELALFLKKNEVIDAINLDGGDSAQMVVRGYTMNNPLKKRLISNGFMIIASEKNKLK